MSSSYWRTASAAFEAATRIPVVKSGRILETCFGTDVSSVTNISAVWTQTSVAAQKKIQFGTSHRVLWNNDGTFTSSRSGFPLSLQDNDLQMQNDKINVQILKFKNEKGNDQEVLHVFNVNGSLERSFNLTDLDIHGPVYFDNELGSIAIRDDGLRVAYIAEAKTPKSTSFLKTINKKKDYKRDTDKKETESEEERFGEEYKYKDEFGEQMVGKSFPVIVLVNLEFNEPSFEVISDVVPKDWCPGQVRFWQNDLVGIAVNVNPRRLGLVYCSNRPSVIFRINLTNETKSFKILSSESGINARSPRLHKDTLIWIQRDFNRFAWFPGPHRSAYKIMKLHLADPMAAPEIVVDENDTSKCVYVGKGEKDLWNFKGIYETGLPNRCFSKDGKFIIFSNILEDTFFPLVIEIDSGKVYVQKKSANNVVLDVCSDVVLGVQSMPAHSPKLSVAKLLSNEENNPLLAFQPIEPSEQLLEDFAFETLWFTPEKPHKDEKYRDVHFSGIFIGPKSASKPKSVPLILWPHGGPHSVIPTSFINDVHFFNRLGYAILFVNFRGSTGSGEKSIASILGNIGDTDVKDCHQAGLECLQKYSFLDPNRVVLLGGSHGGFLVTHLAGQYPDAYKAVVARNPVTNVATMATITDIPDWNCVEAGCSYSFKSPDSETLKKMLEASPISHVDKVQAPVYLMIGKVDLRVPASQGYEYYHALKALGKEVEMNVYDDNHPLAKVPVNINVMINAAIFFDKILKRNS